MGNEGTRLGVAKAIVESISDKQVWGQSKNTLVFTLTPNLDPEPAI